MLRIAHVDGAGKTLASRFPEGATRIAAALRELETYGYLRRIRARTPTGRIVTRTISCNQPAAARHRPEAQDHPEAQAAAAPQQQEACTGESVSVTPT